MWACSQCGRVFIDQPSKEEWALHRLRCHVTDILENRSKESILEAVRLLCSFFKTKSVNVLFVDCNYVGKANDERIVICLDTQKEDFQDDLSLGVPHYEERFGVNHLTVVLLHEFGHVLDRRGLLPAAVAGKTREDRANNFVLFILER